MIFVDSNVVIDLIEEDERWSPWSKAVLGAHEDAALVANVIVLAEVSRTFQTAEDALTFFDGLGIRLAPIDAETAFRAGRAHGEYRLAGGKREAVLSDFLIGAHAATLGAALVTRDRQRFSTYFPELQLITPETDNG